MIVGVGLFTDISEECNLWDVPRNNYVGHRFRCHDLLSTTETPLDILLAVAPKANGAKFVHAGSVLHTFESEDDILVVCRRVYMYQLQYWFLVVVFLALIDLWVGYLVSLINSKRVLNTWDSSMCMWSPEM